MINNVRATQKTCNTGLQSKKISIITVCYNSAETIRDTLESVISQDYPFIEYIVIDGASSDGTMDILDEYRDRIDLIISEADQGIYDAMNKGVRRATGDFIGILNSDDVYSDISVISRVAGALESSGAETLFADLCIVDRFNLDKVLRVCSGRNFRVSNLKWGLAIPHPTFFVSQQCYERLGQYKLGYRVSADFELIARLLYRHEVSYVYLRSRIVKMRRGGISTTGIWGRIHQNLEIVRACRENQIYTNVLMVSMKLPFKLLEYVKARAI